jgi:5-methylcytosine-specific restriction endonuclease McrA
MTREQMRGRSKRAAWARRYSGDRRKILKELARAQHGHCGICGEALGVLDMCNIDHKVPLAKGGSNAKSNLQATHITCNNAKGGG